jgi:hypothetical protein
MVGIFQEKIYPSPLMPTGTSCARMGWSLPVIFITLGVLGLPCMALSCGKHPRRLQTT